MRNAIEAWDTQDGDFIIWGTHDPRIARIAVSNYLVQAIRFKPTGDEEDDELGGLPTIERFINGTREYAHRSLHAEEYWPLEKLSRRRKFGYVPYLVVVN